MKVQPEQSDKPADKALGRGLKELFEQKHISVEPPANDESLEINRLRKQVSELTLETERLDARIRELETERTTIADKLFGKGVSELKNGDFLSAAGSLQGVLAYDPGNVKSMINMAVVFSELGFEKRAVHVLKQALALDPNNDTVKRNLSILSGLQ